MKKVKFNNYHFTSGNIKAEFSKNDYNAFHYSVGVELTLDEQERLATKGKIIYKFYSAGNVKDFRDTDIEEKVQFKDTIPSHVQKRLETMGMTTSFNVKEMEESIIRNCISHYNWKIKDAEYEAARESFMTRKEQFVKEFQELKAKYGIKFGIDQTADYEGYVDTDIILADANFTDRLIETYEDVETFFDN